MQYIFHVYEYKLSITSSFSLPNAESEWKRKNTDSQDEPREQKMNFIYNILQDMHTLSGMELSHLFMYLKCKRWVFPTEAE